MQNVNIREVFAEMVGKKKTNAMFASYEVGNPEMFFRPWLRHLRTKSLLTLQVFASSLQLF